MGLPTSKLELLDLLKARRHEFDAAVATIPRASMMEPGAAGHWSVKDIIAHLAYYEGWMADRLQEQLEGKSYTPTQLDMMHWEPRNTIIYEQNKSRTLEDVLNTSKDTFDRLVAAVEAHDEAFLFEPKTFEGAPGPLILADMLRSEVYDHYPQHIPSLTEWAKSHAS
jgi:hypothetical protein